MHLASCRLGHHDRLDVLQYSRLAVAGLSFLGALSIVVAILINRRLSREKMHPLFSLSLADLLLSAGWLIGVALFHHNKDEPCSLIAYLVLSLELTTHLLTVVYAFVTCVQLVEKNCGTAYSRYSAAERNRIKWWRVRLNGVFYAIAWLLPLLLALPRMLRPPKVTRCTRCLMLWASFFSFELEPSNIINATTSASGSSPLVPTTEAPPSGHSEIDAYTDSVFIAILLLSMILLLVLYGRARYLCNKFIRGGGVIGPQEQQMLHSARKRIVLYLLVFFFCWTIALLVALYVRISGSALVISSDVQYALLLAQAWTMPMQGFLNSLVYGWTRKNFRDANKLDRPNYGALAETTWMTESLT